MLNSEQGHYVIYVVGIGLVVVAGVLGYKLFKKSSVRTGDEEHNNLHKTSFHKDNRLSRCFFVLCLNASEVALSSSETLKGNNASFLLGRAIGFWIGTQDEWQQVSHRLGCRRLSKADLKDLDDAVQILVSYELPFRMQPGPSKGSIITSLKNHKDELKDMGKPLEFNHNIPLSKKGFRRA